MVLDRVNGFEDLTVRDLENIRKRIMSKKVAAIMIDGISGEGKTTLAVLIGLYFEPDFMDNEKFKTRIGLGGADFMAKANEVAKEKTDKVRVVIYDESGDYNKKKVMSSFNHHMGRFFDTYRSSRILPVIVHTGFKDLDPGTLMEKGIVRMLLHCHSRTPRLGRYGAYSLARMFYVLEKMKKITIPQQAYTFNEPNYYGVFKDLPGDKAKLLEDYCNGGKQAIRATALDKIVGKQAISDEAGEGELDTGDIARAIGRSYQTTCNLIKSAGIKPSRKAGVRNLYHSSIIQELELL